MIELNPKNPDLGEQLQRIRDVDRLWIVQQLIERVHYLRFVNEEDPEKNRYKSTERVRGRIQELKELIKAFGRGVLNEDEQ